MPIPTLDEYLATLGRLAAHVDPTASTPQATDIKNAADSLAALPDVDIASIAAWVELHPRSVPVLGLAVGLSQEKLINGLRDRFGTAGWLTLGKTHAVELVTWLDEVFDLVRSLEVQRHRQYHFGDILVARAGTRVTATSAGTTGRKVEDEIELVAKNLGLTYQTRTRFAGRVGRTAPADLVIPTSSNALIAVAAKGFDSTGSKLTDAVREVQEMAEVRLPKQFIIAVIDGIGWKGRQQDLRRIYELWASDQIDGMYTLGTLDVFRQDLEVAARLRGLIP
ncbi:MAG: hypothetical protein HGA44_18695 [Cellulomonadaceae bacterium]|nr:hypothetical protein [Cellulomonadaceae bacterium]